MKWAVGTGQSTSSGHSLCTGQSTSSGHSLCTGQYTCTNGCLPKPMACAALLQCIMHSLLLTTCCMLPRRTNFDCDNLESFLTSLGGGGKFRGKMEKGVENPYSCLVLAGARSMDQRRDALQVGLDCVLLCCYICCYRVHTCMGCIWGIG